MTNNYLQQQGKELVDDPELIALESMQQATTVQHWLSAVSSSEREPNRGRGKVSHLGGGTGDGDGGGRVNGDDASLACGEDDVLAITSTECLTQLGDELQQNSFVQPSMEAEAPALPLMLHQQM